MNIICLTVGKKHDATLAEAIASFEKRLQPYVNFEFDYIPTADKDTESAAILKRLKSDDYVILLDETGKSINNSQFAELINSAQSMRHKKLVIIIGGAYGVTEQVKVRANFILSLSALVFPHQIARLIVVEQLYRSFNLLAGGKYHHS